MLTLVIEQAGEIREAFSYEVPLNEASHFALGKYARATYGAYAISVQTIGHNSCR